MITPPKNLNKMESLIEIVRGLRNPQGGCPWDLQQTNRSLTTHMIEEAHELVEAIESGSREHFIEELGDVLLQVILHSTIAEQEKLFTLTDVVEALNKKLVSRHPHVFSDASAANATEALANWDQQKAKEKLSKPPATTFEIPAGLPALQRSQKIGSRTKKFNFDWRTPQEVRAKMAEEMAELDEALASQNTDAIQEELGDVLFTAAQLARHLDFDAEGSLRKANQKFETRFFKMKALAEKQNKSLQNCTDSELEALWQQVKTSEK